MDPKTKQLVEEAEERATKATEGPWSEICHEHGGCDCGYISGADIRNGMVCEVFRVSSKQPEFSSYSDEQAHYNAQFIAHARSDIPDLCSAVREQDQRAQHAEAERDAFDKRIDVLESDNQRLTKAILEFTNLFGSGDPLTYQKVAAEVVKLRNSIIVQASPRQTSEL